MVKTLAGKDALSGPKKTAFNCVFTFKKTHKHARLRTWFFCTGPYRYHSYLIDSTLKISSTARVYLVLNLNTFPGERMIEAVTPVNLVPVTVPVPPYLV